MGLCFGYPIVEMIDRGSLFGYLIIEMIDRGSLFWLPDY